MKNVGVVVIGRNEGERLKACIRSLEKCAVRIVYVDSASTDGSLDFVKSMGFDVIALDMSIPFSAARARNEGYRYLLRQYSDVQFIQFVDGDCEIFYDWIDKAHNHLQANTKLASVFGLCKERHPDKTIYNKLCDLEWNTPVGLSLATGGNAMFRVEALESVNGYSPQVIAGEEPEMCFRMRQNGWEIERLDLDMVIHDADITHFSQWWLRNERGGHAYIQGFLMHGSKNDEKYCRQDVLRIIVWAFIIPLTILLLFVLLGPVSLVCLLVYPLKVFQLFIRESKKHTCSVAFWYAFYTILGKFPQFQGVCVFLVKHLKGKQLNIIEYK